MAASSNPSEISTQGEELLQNFLAFDLQEEETINDFQTSDSEQENFKSKFPNYRHDIEQEDQEIEEEEQQSLRISKKKRRPDYIDGAPEPKVHTYMKSLRNTIPIPSHWSKGEGDYLQGKKSSGVEKKGYELPDFISERMLEERRVEYEKMGMGVEKVDMCVLKDAFFKYQTKPRMSGYGDLYYEGKEVQVPAASEGLAVEKPREPRWGELQ